MIPIQILRVLSTIRQRDVPALLMGGQACVLYGAAEYSRDLDLAVLATNDALPRLGRAIQALGATVIAVPAFEPQFLARGHAVHFSVPAGPDLPHAGPLRVDIMSRMRGVAPFEQLWERRTTIALPDPTSQADVLVDLLSLPDLVTAKNAAGQGLAHVEAARGRLVRRRTRWPAGGGTREFLAGRAAITGVPARRGWNGHGLPCRGPQARPQGRDQGPQTPACRRVGRRAARRCERSSTGRSNSAWTKR